MRSGRPVTYRETAIRGGDGAPVMVAGGYSAVALGASTGGSQARGSARATGILRDIGAARALEELREGFVATVSHELRTPLSLIRGYAETLLHLDLEPREQREYIEKIDEVTGRLSSLVGQILDVTHLQADPLILERAPVLFVSLATRLRGDLAGTGRADRLVVDLPDDLPPIEVDGGRVGQILDNVVGNAFKYGPPAAGRHHLRARRRATGSRSPSTTRASASRRRSGRSSPSPSIAHGTSASRGSPERGWDCSSRDDSSRRMAAASGSWIGPMVGRAPV